MKKILCLSTTNENMKHLYLIAHFVVVAFLLINFNHAHGQTTIRSSITTNTVWGKTGSPYIISNVITLNKGITLRIEAGVEVRFSVGYLNIYGTVIAQGSGLDSIRFVGSSNKPVGALNFYEGSTGSMLEQTSFKSMETPFTIYDKTRPTINRCRIRDCQNFAQTYVGGAVNLSLIDAQAIKLLLFTSGSVRIPKLGIPYYVGNIINVEQKDTLKIDPGVELRFENNYIKVSGVLIAKGTPSDSIRFVGVNKNGTAGALYFYEGSSASTLEMVSLNKMAIPLFIYSNTSPNINRCRFRNYSISPTTTFTGANNLRQIDSPVVRLLQYGKGSGNLSNLGCPYLIDGGMTLPKGDTLKIRPGVTIQFTGGPLSIEGTLIAEGTKLDSIRMYGFSGGIYGLAFLKGSSASRIKYVSFKKFKTAISTSEAVVMDHLSIRDSEKGVYAVSDVLVGLTISNSDVLYCDTGLEANNCILEIENSSIFGNRAGVSASGNGQIIALYNWWGNPSGPYNFTKNPKGLGDAVSDRVLFDPWLKMAPDQYVFTNIQPRQGGNEGTVTAILRGSGFEKGMKMRLTKSGLPDLIIPDSLFKVMSASRIEVTLPIRGRSAGKHSIKFSFENRPDITIQDAFEVLDGGKAQPYSNIVGFSTIRPGRWQTFALHYGNKGIIDAKGTPIWLMIGDTTTKVELQFKIVPPQNYQYIAKDTSFQINYANIPTSVITDSLLGKKQSGRIIPLYIPLIPAQYSGVLYFNVRTETNNQLELYTYASPPLFVNPFKESAFKCLYEIGWDAIEADDLLEDITASLPVIGCIRYLVDDVWNPAAHALRLGIPDIKVDPKDNVSILLFNKQEEEQKSGIINALEVGSLIWTHVSGIASCIPQTALAKFGATATGVVIKNASLIASKFVQWINKNDNIDDAIERVKQGVACYEAFSEGVELYKQTVRSVNSIDPNDKLSLAGVGVNRYLRNTNQMPYQIRFENLATASASAQSVFITDTLNAKTFDIKSVRLTQVTIGKANYLLPANSITHTGYIDLRSITGYIVRVEATADTSRGIINWILTTIDPKTYDVPADPEAGFLPPNKKYPEGEGSVFFTVNTRLDLANDTRISNRASIIFDSNKPIITPVWTNTLDLEPPTSRIMPINPSADGIFQVRVNGEDRQSGPKKYEIWYAENVPANYKLWKVIEDTTAIFKGRRDSRYYFYSIAIDQVGNRESDPQRYDESTVLVTALEEPNDNVTLFPNPTTGKVIIRFASAVAKTIKIDLVDNLGRIIHQSTLNSISNNEFHLDVSGSPKGSYTLVIQNDNQSWSSKLMIH